MSAVLMAFSIGLAFAVGVIGGVALAMRWIPKNQKRVDEHMKATEDRLAVYAENTGRIANALEDIAQRQAMVHGRES